MSRYLTNREAAEYLGLHPTRVRALAREGRIKFRETLRGRIYTVEDLEAFARRPRKPGRPRKS